MDLALRSNPIETAVDAAAAAALAGAIAFAASMLAGWAAVLALPAFVPIFVALRRTEGGAQSYCLPEFEPADLPQQEEFQELVLTAELIVGRRAAHCSSNPPDAAQALSDALAQLRRSLH